MPADETKASRAACSAQKIRQRLLALPARVATHGERASLDELMELLDTLQLQRSRLGSEQDAAAMAGFRDACLELALLSELGQLAYYKHRGYPGDFLTQEAIWFGRTQPAGHRYRGTTELGGLINALSLDMAACRANEHRLRVLGTWLERGFSRVASIGSGSGMEYWALPLSRDLADLDLLLLDQDGVALERCRERVRPRGLEPTLHCANVLRVVAANQRQDVLGRRDLVYSLGLFDYFDVPRAQRVVRHLWQAVEPGGTLLVTNVHVDNPSRTWMEYAGDWFLVHKSQDEMMSLAQDLPDAEELEWSLDPFRVYQYLAITRRGPCAWRA